jgi:5-methylthioadenosine/S-adenosylhomocysteine deaminase
MVDILIKNAIVITVDRDRRIIKDGGIAVDEGRITAVGPTRDVVSGYRGEEIIDGEGMAAIPGLINAHTHMYQDLLRGMGDDMNLMEWLRNMLFPNNAAVTPEDAYVGSLLGCVEMLKTGTTYVIDNHHANTTERSINNVARAIEESGIRGLIARGMKEMETRTDSRGNLPREGFFTPEEDIKTTKSLMDQWNFKKDSRVKICPGPTSTMVAGTEFFQKVKELADKYNVPIHTHIAEVREEVENTLKNHGLREIEYLHKIGVLGPRFHVVHGVWLDAVEIRLMAESGAHLIHNPVSNMVLASGVSPVQKMLDAGVNVALATDGPASNNNQDMFGVLKATAMLQKVSTLDPKATPCEKVLEMATLGGARALNMEDEIGSLEVGKRADIVLVDLMKPHIMPLHNPVSALVYSAMGSDVHTTIVDGKIVVRSGKILTVSEKELLHKSQEVADSLVERSRTEHLRQRTWPRS